MKYLFFSSVTLMKHFVWGPHVQGRMCLPENIDNTGIPPQCSLHPQAAVTAVLCVRWPRCVHALWELAGKLGWFYE